ncbi:hypothetical protein ACI48D_05700 [Massilia sp. LXY-6]
MSDSEPADPKDLFQFVRKANCAPAQVVQSGLPAPWPAASSAA